MSFYPDDTLGRGYSNVNEDFRDAQRNYLFQSICTFLHHNRPIEGYYFEFGCHSGRTMRLAYDALSLDNDFTYVAFDSFEGLPEVSEIDQMATFKKGNMATSEKAFIRILMKHGIPKQKLITVKGFYDQTLTPALGGKLQTQSAAVIYIDCDLYASTVTVLEFIRPFLQRGTIIVFDDWFSFFGDPEYGERRAFSEFQERYPFLRFQEFVHTNEAQAFIYLGEGA